MWLWLLSLGGIDKIRNHLVTKPIFSKQSSGVATIRKQTPKIWRALFASFPPSIHLFHLSSRDDTNTCVARTIINDSRAIETKLHRDTRGFQPVYTTKQGKIDRQGISLNSNLSASACELAHKNVKTIGLVWRWNIRIVNFAIKRKKWDESAQTSDVYIIVGKFGKWFVTWEKSLNTFHPAVYFFINVNYILKKWLKNFLDSKTS